MKKHHFLSFLKGTALVGLAFATFSAVCLSLTACGGGGGDEDASQEARAAKYFEGKYLTLQATTSNCEVQLESRIKGTGIVMASISYGNTNSVGGMLIITDPEFGDSDDVVNKATVKIATRSGSITEEDDFKRWWGAQTGENAQDVVFESGEMPIMLSFGPAYSDTRTGTYTIAYELDKGEGDKQEKTMIGTAVLSRGPLPYPN